MPCGWTTKGIPNRRAVLAAQWFAGCHRPLLWIRDGGDCLAIRTNSVRTGNPSRSICLEAELQIRQDTSVACGWTAGSPGTP